MYFSTETDFYNFQLSEFRITAYFAKYNIKWTGLKKIRIKKILSKYGCDLKNIYRSNVLCPYINKITCI